ncbi:MAG: 6-phosphofructokinase [Clostridia bacterium]|nr:MAG: 6-phosphofructokinase [Clostridia bacterium]
MQRLGVLTSGGDAPGMNAAIRAVVRTAVARGLKVTGIAHGFAGLIAGEFQEMDSGSVAGIIHRGGTILRTARSAEFMRPEGQAKAVVRLQEAGIDALIAIGGDGTFRGTASLAAMGIPAAAVPATIDNDIAGTDYSIGFDTAVNTAVEAINKIRDTATSHERVFLIEVMGRESGHIALMAGLAGGAESILVPEIPFDLQVVMERVIKARQANRLHSIIVVAEGAAGAPGLGEEIARLTNMETRVTILGHIQRGGTPTAYDRILASRMGAAAVELLLAGRRGFMAGLVGEGIVARDLDQVVGRRKEISRELYELAAVLA